MSDDPNPDAVNPEVEAATEPRPAVGGTTTGDLTPEEGAQQTSETTPDEAVSEDQPRKAGEPDK